MIYSRLDKEMRAEYFPALKLTGVGGIVMPYDKVFSSNLINAKDNDLSVWVELSRTDRVDATYLDCDASGVIYLNDTAKILSLTDFKEAVNALHKSDLALIDGIIVKYPEFSWMLWDESFKKEFYDEFSNYIEDYLYLLFEPYEKQSAFRTWYYEKCADFIYKTYLAPLLKWSKSKGIKLCFDIGNEESEYHYITRHIDIFGLLERGVNLLVNHNTVGINETCILFSKYDADFFVAGDVDDSALDNLDINYISRTRESLQQRNESKEKILLIRPTRGIMERCAKAKIYLGYKVECDAVIASFEGTYYTDMLHEKGFSFEVASEKLFEKYSKYKDGTLTYKNHKIDQVLLCKSCVFTQKGIRLLNRIADGGICVNNTNLIKILGSDLL